MAVDQPRAGSRAVCIDHDVALLKFVLCDLAYGSEFAIGHHNCIAIDVRLTPIAADNGFNIDDPDFHGLLHCAEMPT